MTTIIALVFLIILVTTLYTTFRGAPFVGVNDAALSTILEFAGPQNGDAVVDLGSGDGRVLIRFTKDNDIKAHGFEINPLLVFVSWLKIKRLGLGDKIKLHFRDFWSANLKDYDVIVVFGISYMMSKLEKKIKKEAKPGTRVISYSYSFPNLIVQKEKSGVYLYVV